MGRGDAAKAQEAVRAFLIILGEDVPPLEAFRPLLGLPVERDDPDEGLIERCAGIFGTFVVAARANEVIGFSRPRNPADRPPAERPEGYGADDARPVALHLVDRLTSDFRRRRFEIGPAEVAEHRIAFTWNEVAREGAFAVPLNSVRVEVCRASLKVLAMDRFEFRHELGRPPRLSADRGRRIALGAAGGKGMVTSLKLYERVSGRGTRFEPVYAIAVRLPNPRFKIRKDLLVDADSGAILSP